MRPDDPALNAPCPKCKALTGEPCVLTTTPRAGLLELEYAHKERRSAVAGSRSLSDHFVPPAEAVDTSEREPGAAEGRPFDPPTSVPTVDEEVDRAVARAADAPASLGQLPLVELECGHPASEQQAYRALQLPNADIFCFICARHVERAS